MLCNMYNVHISKFEQEVFQLLKCIMDNTGNMEMY